MWSFNYKTLLQNEPTEKFKLHNMWPKERRHPKKKKKRKGTLKKFHEERKYSPLSIVVTSYIIHLPRKGFV